LIDYVTTGPARMNVFFLPKFCELKLATLYFLATFVFRFSLRRSFYICSISCRTLCSSISVSVTFFHSVSMAADFSAKAASIAAFLVSKSVLIVASSFSL
jgi:hypothetical protein